jgi:excisionase family DNA binding protein
VNKATTPEHGHLDQPQEIKPLAVYTIEQAAEVTGLSESTIRRAIRAGKIKITKTGLTKRGLRIPGTSLLAALGFAPDTTNAANDTAFNCGQFVGNSSPIVGKIVGGRVTPRGGSRRAGKGNPSQLGRDWLQKAEAKGAKK